MSDRRCSGCGAPLAAESGNSCPFCGLEQETAIASSNAGRTIVTYERVTVDQPAPPPPRRMTPEEEREFDESVKKVAKTGAKAVGCLFVGFIGLCVFMMCGRDVVHHEPGEHAPRVDVDAFGCGG